MHQAARCRRDPNHGLARSHRPARHTDDQRGGAAARRAPYNPDACPPNGPAGTGLRPARCAASSCPVADRTSERECESDQPVRRVPSEKFGLADSFPLDIVVANLVAAFLLGLVTALHRRQIVSEGAEMLVGTGIAGGLSTFSSFAYGTVVLMSASTAS